MSAACRHVPHGFLDAQPGRHGRVSVPYGADMMIRHKQRHLGRELALQWLYQIDVGQQPADIVMAEVPQDVEELEAIEEEGVGYAQQLAHGVLGHRDELDALIEQFARGWSLERMAAIERNVLRIALFEIIYQHVPPSVVADEAVEISKHYASDESGKFVNGILGGYIRAQK